MVGHVISTEPVELSKLIRDQIPSRERARTRARPSIDIAWVGLDYVAPAASFSDDKGPEASASRWSVALRTSFRL